MQTNQNAVWPLSFELDSNIFKSLPELEIYTLDSGLRVLLLPGADSRSLRMQVLVNGGAIHQTTSKRGVPHFLEHLMFRSTEEFSDKEALTNFMQDYNIDHNGFTGDDNQGYWIISDLDEDAIDAAARVLSQITLHPLLEEKYVEMEKQIIYTERESGESEPHIVVWDTLADHFHGNNHPLGGGGIIGETETIKGYTHEDALNFHREYFTPDNMLLIMSGGVSKDNMKKLVNKYFNVGQPSGWKQNKLIEVKRETNRLETVNIRDFNHVSVNIGYYLPAVVLPRYSPEFYALRIIDHALTTRLTLDVREKQGLAYFVCSSYTDFNHGVFFHASGEFAKDKYKQGAAELNKYMSELSGMQITAEEFRRALRMMKSTRWADNTHSIAMHAANKLFVEGQAVSPEYSHVAIDQLTLEFVNSVPAKLFTGIPLESILVGPVS